MRAPRRGVSIMDSVVCQPTIEKTAVILEIDRAEWHTGYGQWLFNAGDRDEFYESQITHWYDDNKKKWRKY